MPLIIAYITVILVWSTTPLGIVWSSTSVSPTLALLLRMSLALVLGWLIIMIMRINFPWHKQAIRLYSYSALGIAGGMIFTYLAARSVPSSFISLLFGLAPMLSGLFAQKILNEKPFTRIRKVSLVLSMVGLFIVVYDNLFVINTPQTAHHIGFIYVMIAVVLFSLSSVLVKSVKLTIHPLSSTIGALTIALPFYIVTWYIFDGNFVLPEYRSKAFWSILYLSLFASLIGFIAYFYVLQRVSASTLSLVMLITPVIAMALGSQLNNEVISQHLLLGAALILFALFLYFFGHLCVNVCRVKVLKEE